MIDWVEDQEAMRSDELIADALGTVTDIAQVGIRTGFDFGTGVDPAVLPEGVNPDNLLIDEHGAVYDPISGETLDMDPSLLEPGTTGQGIKFDPLTGKALPLTFKEIMPKIKENVLGISRSSTKDDSTFAAWLRKYLKDEEE